MTITLHKAIAGLAAAGSLTLAGAAPALAGTGPVNAPTAVTGTFYCTDTASGDFVASGNYVINAGKANVQTWESGILTFTLGLTGTGVFIQTGQQLGTPSPVFKGSATLADPGPLKCSIESPPGTPIGTVWGKIVTTG
jgi:hypothetical protein